MRIASGVSVAVDSAVLMGAASCAGVGVGAPVRSSPDYSSMSAEEKIARGIEQRRA